ncbi:MAG: hypothetical protein WBV85_08530 [Solirubrobacteraceae bacterium]
MRKYSIAIVSFIAVLAFCAVGVSAAVAEITIDTLLAEWLVNGVAVATNLNVKTEGELLLEDTKTPLGAADVLCSGILDGTVGANGADTVTALLTLGKVATGTPLTGESITCTSQKFCGEEALAWAVNLPWTSLLELVEELEGGVLVGSPFFADLLTGNGGTGVGYYLQCKTLGVTIDDECIAAQGASEATNIAAGVTGTFSEAFTTLVGDKLGICSLSKEESAIVEGTGTETLETGAEVLSVSSTG